MIDKALFSKAPHLAAAELKQVQDGVITSQLMNALKVGGKGRTLVFENELLAKAAENAGLQVLVKANPVAEKFQNQP